MNEKTQTKEYSCEGCGKLLPMELIEELNKGNPIYCENCGAKNILKQDSNLRPEGIKNSSSKDATNGISQVTEILKVESQKNKSFFFKLKRYLRRTRRKKVRTSRNHRVKFNGRGHRHRGKH